ncbi:transposase zinc-binding domain-containing protein [Clostridium beijerinckii]|uniref:Transposase zinc-binding domain-containing protein n=1 Tax=Clostridium beijerinckii TaxID=1520 RepID=A0A1S9N2Q4_CLOBE|nr:transposase zinc-binding domain-containing protein [Clostridium beijerinckii]OOP71705.1 hypothetical protein CBEIBR21_19030 [Clostridium beijerinckii]
MQLVSYILCPSIYLASKLLECNFIIITYIIKNKITVKDVLEDKYSEFENKYLDKVTKRMRIQIDQTVNKAMKCSNIKYGFAEYVCEECGESIKVPFTCRSKFCSGRLYSVKWQRSNRRIC